jgi:hypothetical protein
VRKYVVDVSANKVSLRSSKGGFALLTNRDQRGAASFDELAMALGSDAITRGKAIKLTGAALAASALGIFASEGEAEARRRCRTLSCREKCRRCRRSMRCCDACRRCSMM